MLRMTIASEWESHLTGILGFQLCQLRGLFAAIFAEEYVLARSLADIFSQYERAFEGQHMGKSWKNLEKISIVAG